MSIESLRAKLHLRNLLPNLAGLFLVAFGFIVLAWVGWLTWHDLTSWGKDIILIFFGSRTGEAISLGIGLKIIHYFLIGFVLLVFGLLTFLERTQEPTVRPTEMEKKLFSGCLYHFGYLASRPKNTPIPPECILCQRLGDCMVTTVFIDKAEKESLG